MSVKYIGPKIKKATMPAEKKTFAVFLYLPSVITMPTINP